VVKAPTVPRRAFLPIALSTISSGIDQLNRKISHGMRNVPPPLAAMMRGKRQMFPVPITIPRAARIRPQREAKRSVRDIEPSCRLHREVVPEPCVAFDSGRIVL
jgi:hypothetical protein